MTQTAAPQWLDYVTIDDAVAWVGLGDVEIDLIQMIVSLACDWVQSFLDRPVTPTPITRRFDGGRVQILLPYSPVVFVTTVTEYGGSGGVVLPEATPTARLDGYQIDAALGCITRVNGIYPKSFLPGSRSVEVSWIAGYATVPPKIKLATLELIKHWWENTQENSGITSTPGAGGTDYSTEAPTGMWTGIPHRVEAMLQPLNRIALG